MQRRCFTDTPNDKGSRQEPLSCVTRNLSVHKRPLGESNRRPGVVLIVINVTGKNGIGTEAVGCSGTSYVREIYVLAFGKSAAESRGAGVRGCLSGRKEGGFDIIGKRNGGGCRRGRLPRCRNRA